MHHCRGTHLGLSVMFSLLSTCSMMAGSAASSAANPAATTTTNTAVNPHSRPITLLLFGPQSLSLHWHKARQVFLCIFTFFSQVNCIFFLLFFFLFHIDLWRSLTRCLNNSCWECGVPPCKDSVSLRHRQELWSSRRSPAFVRPVRQGVLNCAVGAVVFACLCVCVHLAPS